MRRGNSPISTSVSFLFAVFTATARRSFAWRRGWRGGNPTTCRRQGRVSPARERWTKRRSRGFGRKVSGAQRGEEPYLGLFNSLALIVSLAGSAYLTVEAAGGRGPAISAWCALIPIFVSVLVLSPVRAMAGGVFWGSSVFAFHALFAARGGEAAVALTLKTLLVLAALPGVYAGLASWLTRRIGFSPLVAAAGWLGLALILQRQELVLADPSLSTASGLVAAWVANTLGTAWLAFLIAYVCALVVLATDLIAAKILGRPLRLNSGRGHSARPAESQFSPALRLPGQCLARAPPKVAAILK